MASSPATQLAGRLQTIINEAYDRYAFSITEARARRYSASNLLSDAVVGWVDLVEAACLPYKLLSDATSPIIVPFEITMATTRATATRRIPDTGLGGAKLTAPDNLKHDTAASHIPKASVTGEITTSGEGIVVVLNNLSNLLEGRYSGDVTDGGKFTAKVEVLVSKC